MRILFQPTQQKQGCTVSYQGKTEAFWKAYNKNLKGIPLKDTILTTISNEQNLIGEGLTKKGYEITGLKDYVIRVYKAHFKKEDLITEFTKPVKNFLNTLDNVILNIPNKIDIVKKKNGTSIGVANYAERIQINDFPPLRNINITREETLRSLEIYEKLKDFPISSYKKAYLQMKRFCKKPGFQFDILSPNNILIDTKKKEINLIDPVSPRMNDDVHGKLAKFSEIHGVDSLYPVLCDFIMQKEHLQNLTPEETARWEQAIHKIIIKCSIAGKSIGLERNIESLKKLYQNIDKFWQTDDLCKRFDNFINKYSDSIDQNKIIKNALNIDNSVKNRINSIKKLDSENFEQLKPIFEKIIEAPHQPKVEFPEILNATIDKLLEFGNSAKSITPTLEGLFNKEIFCTTKQRLFNFFIKTEPENKIFLEEMGKSANNPFEKILFEKEFRSLQKKSKKLHPNIRKTIKQIYSNSNIESYVPKNLINKLWISRTCTKTSPIQEISINNMIKTYEYIEANKNKKPTIENLIEIHKLSLADTKGEEHIIGRLRTPDTDAMIKKLFNIKDTGRKLVNEYSDSKDVVRDLELMEKYIHDNFDKMDLFELATYIFSETIRIHPFLNGNGRATRLFVEQFLLSKGYQLQSWPEETLYRKIVSTETLTNLLKNNSVKIN